MKVVSRKDVTENFLSENFKTSFCHVPMKIEFDDVNLSGKGTLAHAILLRFCIHAAFSQTFISYFMELFG